MTALSEIARARGIRHFLVSHVDLFGVSRAKLVPATVIDAVATSGSRFAGATSWLDLSPADPDLRVIPDPTSLIQLPWQPEVGWLAGEPWMNGEPLGHSPRVALKRVIAAGASGALMKTGVECEFFLLSPDGTAADAGDEPAQKVGYDQAGLMRRFDFLAEICEAMLTLGWEPQQAHHEEADDQFEINWRHEEALVTADRHVFFKDMVKAIAGRHGLRATFMPKLFVERAGNGCHVHASLWQDGKNLFDAPGEPLGLSPTGRQFIAGLMAAAPELCAITNPTVNSYKRINSAGPGPASRPARSPMPATTAPT